MYCASGERVVRGGATFAGSQVEQLDDLIARPRQKVLARPVESKIVHGIHEVGAYGDREGKAGFEHGQRRRRVVVVVRGRRRADATAAVLAKKKGRPLRAR